jgi:7-cyano-7-deazaguanine synthase
MKIVSEISGGADSMVSTLMAKEMFPKAKIYGIMINYGQLPFDIEYDKAEKFCKREDIKLKVVEVKNLFTSGTITGEKNADKVGVAKIYTPLRNYVIIAIASSYAESLGAKYIITGSKGLNDDGKPYSFRDSLLPFYELNNAVLNYTSYKSIKILPILMYKRNNKMSKRDVYQYLNDYGYTINDFWNCFNTGHKRCGYCNNCIELNSMEEVFKNYSSKN